MTYVSFSFDTEDFINPSAIWCIKEIADILTRNDVKGCFNVVGWLAKLLKEMGRDDVIEAVKRHEIDSHSLKHSWHPTINEYTDIEDIEEAIGRFVKEESENIAILKEIFGVDSIPAWCPPGNSTSYAGHYGCERLGFKAYCGDELTDRVRFRPINFCNLVCTRYSHDLVATLLELKDEDIPNLLDELAKAEYVTWANHPQEFIHTAFWDGINLRGKNRPKEEWEPSPERTKDETDGLFKKFELLVQAIKNDSRFKIVTYSECAEIYGGEGRVITKDMLPDIAAQIEEYFFPVTTPDSFCIADIVLACRDFLKGKSEHACEKVYGFVDTPYAIQEEMTLNADEIALAAHQIGNGFLPEKLYIGGKTLGVADWLFGAFAVLNGAENV
ncbi:MAG: polysaccharide deacetylase family protein, partial [Clostridia bacterium]|nr:polysaccharide deacetylase family protein [Clostridia bacterium]